jgi:hypothetical protein
MTNIQPYIDKFQKLVKRLSSEEVEDLLIELNKIYNISQRPVTGTYMFQDKLDEIEKALDDGKEALTLLNRINL